MSAIGTVRQPQDVDAVSGRPESGRGLAGLSIDDIHQFGSCVRAPNLDAAPCMSALEVCEQRLLALETKIATLNHLRATLAEQTERLRRDLRV